MRKLLQQSKGEQTHGQKHDHRRRPDLCVDPFRALEKDQRCDGLCQEEGKRESLTEVWAEESGTPWDVDGQANDKEEPLVGATVQESPDDDVVVEVDTFCVLLRLVVLDEWLWGFVFVF